MTDKIIERIRNRVVLEPQGVINAHSNSFPGNYPGYDDAFYFDKFCEGFQFKVCSITGDDMEFDLVGVDASIANALRRILISEVPTMAIENAFIESNSTVLADEIFCHRLGLIPLNVDPRFFRYVQDPQQLVDLDTIVFDLNVKCTRKPGVSNDETDPEKKFNNHKILSSDLIWRPQGNQEAVFGDKPIGPVHDDILICKMRPGQGVSMRLNCHLNIGKVHAKWSPVATASYRLHPKITLTQRVTGAKALKIQKCFSPGVIAIERGPDGEDTAVVANERIDTMSREVLRHEDLRECVRLERQRDHFIFQVESTGALAPDVLLVEALGVLKQKCATLIERIEKLESTI